MGAIAPIRATDVTYSDNSLALIKRTVASDCNNDEFNVFIHMARALNLDPLRRQIYAFVFSKDNPDKRRMSIITGIDGFRAIAERTGNYRPDEDEPTYETDDGLKGPNNPAGIVKATVRVWKYSHGAWHKVTASAYWDEYAPLKEQWAYDEAKGKKAPTGRFLLDTSGNWPKMPRVMIAKCAEAQALRKAWPDDFSNVYADEEVDRVRVLDISPAEMAAQGEVAERMERIGGPGLTVDWLVEHEPLERVPVGQFADRAMAFLREHAEEPSQVLMWQSRNRHVLREFWAHQKADALELNKEIERLTAGDAA
jgi:phage recombination protein Bet